MKISKNESAGWSSRSVAFPMKGYNNMHTVYCKAAYN